MRPGVGIANRYQGKGIMSGSRSSSPLVKSITFVLLMTGLPGVASAADPYGVWIRPSTGTQVHFYDCGGKLCGKIVAVKDQSRKGEIGTVIMRGAVKSSNDQWKGDLLNTDNGASCKTPGEIWSAKLVRP